MPGRGTRETRASAAPAAKQDVIDTPGNKRKRRTTPPQESPLKVVLPSPATLAQAQATNPPIATIHISPTKVNGEGINGDAETDHEPKRQRISLKINGEKAASPEIVDKVQEVVEAPIEGALSKDVRDALAIVISRMAINLPAPLNGILSLWLPPDFKQSEDNTLGYILRQNTLTWEQLVDTIHIFSENLLVPCQYPNPVPPRSQFRLPVPPLPSHFPPHAIYNFCAALHSLLLEIETRGEEGAGLEAERWALMQKTPHSGEWFTSAVNAREAEKKKGGKEATNVLEKLAATGDHFGNATAVSLQSIIGGHSSRQNPTLSESLVRRASLKMNRWKELRAAKRAGGFGSITRGVTVPAVASVGYTPTFGPTFDSTDACGQGYYSTLQGMHEHARHREWSRRVFRRSKSGEEGWYGLDSEAKGKEKETIEDVLAENGEMIQELQAWQELRVRKGFGITERENAVADELLASLTRLTGHISPAEMLPASTSKVGLAHELARRFIPVSSPGIRGTLDPRRRHALHDNITVRLRTPAGQTLGGPISGTSAASPHAPPPTKSGMPPPPIPQYMPAPPHTLPSPANAAGAAAPGAQGQRYQPYARGTPPASNPIYGRSNTPTMQQQSPLQGQGQGQQNYTRPGPGPSALRQSFGPGAPVSPFGPLAGLRQTGPPRMG